MLEIHIGQMFFNRKNCRVLHEIWICCQGEMLREIRKRKFPSQIFPYESNVMDGRMDGLTRSREMETTRLENSQKNSLRSRKKVPWCHDAAMQNTQRAVNWCWIHCSRDNSHLYWDLMIEFPIKVTQSKDFLWHHLFSLLLLFFSSASRYLLFLFVEVAQRSVYHLKRNNDGIIRVLQ